MYIALSIYRIVQIYPALEYVLACPACLLKLLSAFADELTVRTVFPPLLNAFKSFY